MALMFWEGEDGGSEMPTAADDIALYNFDVAIGSGSAQEVAYDSGYYTPYTQAESGLRGGNNSLALVSTSPQTDAPGQSSFAGLNNVLGAVSSIARNITQTARDVGTAVGTVQRDFKGAPVAYETARQNAASGNKLAQWLEYSSTQDKLTVGIAVAGLIYLISKG